MIGNKTRTSGKNRLTRRSFIAGIASTAAVGFGGCDLLARNKPFLKKANRSKPNVLLIMTDDQGWGDIGSHGNPVLKTPVMDGIAAAGARFERFYVSPVCAPTRASLPNRLAFSELSGSVNLACPMSNGLTMP